MLLLIGYNRYHAPCCAHGVDRDTLTRLGVKRAQGQQSGTWSIMYKKAATISMEAADNQISSSKHAEDYHPTILDDAVDASSTYHPVAWSDIDRSLPPSRSPEYLIERSPACGFIYRCQRIE